MAGERLAKPDVGDRPAAFSVTRQNALTARTSSPVGSTGMANRLKRLDPVSRFVICVSGNRDINRKHRARCER